MAPSSAHVEVQLSAGHHLVDDVHLRLRLKRESKGLHKGVVRPRHDVPLAHGVRDLLLLVQHLLRHDLCVNILPVFCSNSRPVVC